MSTAFIYLDFSYLLWYNCRAIRNLFVLTTDLPEAFLLRPVFEPLPKLFPDRFNNIVCDFDLFVKPLDRPGSRFALHQ